MSTKELTLENLQTESPKFKNAKHFPRTRNGQRLRKIGHKNFDNYFPFQYSTISFDQLWDFKEIRNRVLYKVKKMRLRNSQAKRNIGAGEERFQVTSRAQATLRPKRKRVFSAKIEFIRENRAEATENQQ